MDWIKKHYDRVALLVAAVALLAASALVITRSKGFPSLFSAVEQPIAPGKKVVPADITAVEEAGKKLDAPAGWQVSHPGSLFVSRRYLVIDGQLVDPFKEGETVHPPVENAWITKYNLDLLNPNILNEDPDGDGFTVLDEYLGKSNPIDKASRPSYSTKLRLKRYIRKPFRLLFAAYDGESFQVNTLDLRQPSQFLKVGEDVKGTKFKILKFEKKTELNERTGIDKDVSELVLENTESKEQVTLVLRQAVDSPDSYALFKFLWDGSEFSIKKGGKFALKVEPKVQYRLVDIDEAGAVIKNEATDDQVKVPRLETGSEASDKTR